MSQLAWLLCQSSKDPGKPGGALGMVDGFSEPRHEKQKPKVGQTGIDIQRYKIHTSAATK